jgi:cyclopropane-fatty-acyl-phospholipid synthase
MANNNVVRVKGRESLSRKVILNLFKRIQQGRIQLNDGEQCYEFSDSHGANGQGATIDIIHPRAYKKVLLGGSVGAGKSYIDGDWDTDDLQQLIEIFIKNAGLFDKLESPFARFLIWVRKISAKLNVNTVKHAKDNILAHYDLGNDFFQLILDPSMMYSCALYEPSDIDLDEAAKKKLQRICEKLELKPTDHVLEIGTGWGGFACYAAQKYGCKITTTTISDKQYAFVKEKIKQLGLGNQIELLNQDYRKLTGHYDKVVSIEMIEAVGHKYFDTFFHQCNKLVKPQGLFFLQAIVINDQAYEVAKNEVDFIKKYIFPGGCLPSMFSISKSIATQTKMQLISFDDIGKHYVATLNDWHKKLLANKKVIMAQGFTENFIRMWEFYFCYSAAGFKSNHISNIHALWQKRG